MKKMRHQNLNKKKPGNGHRGALSSVNPKGSKAERVQDLKFRLISTELALAKAKLREVPKKSRRHQSYAAAVATSKRPQVIPGSQPL